MLANDWNIIRQLLLRNSVQFRHVTISESDDTFKIFTRVTCVSRKTFSPRKGSSFHLFAPVYINFAFVRLRYVSSYLFHFDRRFADFPRGYHFNLWDQSREIPEGCSDTRTNSITEFTNRSKRANVSSFVSPLFSFY